MVITGLKQENRFEKNIKLTGIEVREDIHNFFQAITTIIDEPDSQLKPAWFPNWTFTRLATQSEWYISLFGDSMLCEQMSGVHNVGLSHIPYDEIESIECDLLINGSQLVGIWITLKNGVQIRLG